jgi:hypothetical protein
VGAPPGFPPGDSWTIPLVGPLEDGQLLVPALVNGRGPFVFSIDTDAHVSIVDTDVVQEIAPRTGPGPDILDESDTERDRFYAEILEWNLGTLTIKNKPAQIVPANVFDIEGRRVHGVIGRDILAESIVFAFDRDKGEIHLQTKSSFRPPAGDQRTAYSSLESRIPNAHVRPLPRKLVDATINGTPFRMHLDFGATASQLRSRSWAKATLVESALVGSVVDEVGSLRKVDKQGLAATVALGAATANDVKFVSYADRRWPDEDLEGTLGLDFFKPLSVTADWDGKQIYLRRRTGLSDVKPRIGRWHSKTLSSCEQVGCVKISLVDPLANKPDGERPAKHPGVVVSVTREAVATQLDLEVLAAVTAVDGTPLQWLVINLPYSTDRALAHVGEEYVGATVTVLDASPFPRTCHEPKASCIDLLAPPQPFMPAGIPIPDAAPPKPTDVAPPP